MSATVLGSTQVRDLIDSNFIEAAPQVHLHFLTDEDEYKRLGYGKLEACCHGCGESLLIYYTENDRTDVDSHMKIRDEFTNKHRSCPNRGYEKSCPSYRSSTSILDLREEGHHTLRAKTFRVLRDKEPTGRALSEEVHAKSFRPQEGRRSKRG